MKRTASRPTSSTTSRSVTNSPDRFDIFTSTPARSQLHELHDLDVELGAARR